MSRKQTIMKQTTIKEIAGRLNKSVTTVSRALNDHSNISQATKQRVRQLVKEMNYEPNYAAIFFQQKKTFTIGVILPELSESFFSSAISGIEDTADASRYTLLIGQSHNNEEREKEIIATMRKHRVDGLLISISKNTTRYAHFETLKKNGVPTVFFDCIPEMPDIHYIACNIQSGTMEAMGFLLKQGHRAIGLINGPEKLFASKERKQGYINAMIKHRLKFDPSLIISSNLTQEGNYSAMQQLLSLKRKPTAILTFSDHVALDASFYVRSLNLAKNQEISFVSCSNSPMNHYFEFPPVASVEQYPYSQGQQAASILLDLLNRDKKVQQDGTYQKIIIESRLIVHELP
jgi:DNA-binding LacI/PurR family transcriptional regulator